MSDEVTLPPLPSDSATVDELRTALRSLILWANAREPQADGTAFDKFLTARAAVDAGQLTFVPGSGYVGGGGGGFVPGPGTSNPADATPPTPISGLTVTPGVTFFFIEFDAPTYTQGGGNGRTIIYQANYSGSGALPTFADAVEAATVPGKSTIVVIDAEPGVQAHFWVKAETRHPTLQASPTGGTNGVSATSGQIDGAEHIVALSIGTAQIANLAVTDAKIASLSVSKLIAGSIAVGEYIQSTGYTGAGSNEWRIDGNGVARFTGVIVSGTITATSGAIGGIVIGATYLRSTNYATTGFQLLDDGTATFGSGATFGGTLAVGTSPAVSGTTMTGTGAVFNTAGTFAVGNSTKNISFNGTTLTVNGDVVATGNIVANAATKINIDQHDFAAATFGTTTARTWSFTPAVDCTIEFTAKLTASQLLGDSGQYFRWYVTPSGGSDLLLGGSETNNTTRQEVTAVNSFSAVGGVQLDFTIRTTVTGPSIALYTSYMRATEIKR